jgi:hypothetical protein
MSFWFGASVLAWASLWFTRPLGQLALPHWPISYFTKDVLMEGTEEFWEKGIGSHSCNLKIRE